MHTGIEEILHFLMKITFQIRLQANLQVLVTRGAWHEPDTSPWACASCKGDFKSLFKRCLTSAKAEIHIQTSGSKGLRMMSIKLWLWRGQCRLPGNLIGCFTAASWFLSTTPNARRDLRNLQQQGDTAACAPRAARSACAAPGDLSQGQGEPPSQKPAQTQRRFQTHPWVRFPHGERGYVQESRMCRHPHPSPSGQRVIRTVGGFEMQHMRKRFVRNPTPLTLRAAAPLSQSKLSRKKPISLCVGSKPVLRDVLQGLFTSITPVLPFHWSFAVILMIIHHPKRHSLRSRWKTKPQQGVERHIWRRLPSRTFSIPERSQEHGGAMGDQGLCVGGIQLAKSSRHRELPLYSLGRNSSCPVHTLESFWTNPSAKSGLAQIDKSKSSFNCKDVWCSRTSIRELSTWS